MIWALYSSIICVLCMHIMEDNMWAFMFFALLNAIAINVAFKRYEKLINRIEKLERSQDEKKGGSSNA